MAGLIRVMMICGRYVKYLPSLIKFIYELIKLYKKMSHKPNPVIKKEVEVAKKTRDTSKLEAML